ncbi:Uncharacterised protein [Staphylococcus gallinarum]|uniref:Uncharacterized protein n=1 Tax=Staphylococcus gallinarum TaxID=1293 RepID=A0A380FFC9_STAGA|nr:Uncharacterised protein [Staphylococcus gallinarum]
MGLKNKFTNKFTKEVGNKVLNIEDIKEKHQLPVNLFEVDERRERAQALVKKEIAIVIKC